MGLFQLDRVGFSDKAWVWTFKDTRWRGEKAITTGMSEEDIEAKIADRS